MVRIQRLPVLHKRRNPNHRLSQTPCKQFSSNMNTNSKYKKSWGNKLLAAASLYAWDNGYIARWNSEWLLLPTPGQSSTLVVRPYHTIPLNHTIPYHYTTIPSYHHTIPYDCCCHPLLYSCGQTSSWAKRRGANCSPPCAATQIRSGLSKFDIYQRILDIFVLKIFCWWSM